MSLFTSETNNILTDPKWLQPLSDPPDSKPICREAYLKLMASNLADLFTTGQARNLFIYGKPGTGKTACVKHLLSEVAKHAMETNAPVLTAYVNAGKTRTPYYTLTEILKQLNVTVPGAGWQMFRLKHTLENLLAEKSLLLAIDEVDSIIFKEKEPLVYYLNRQLKTTLILISNDVDDVVKLPERALSTLQPVLIPLEPYTQEETMQILRSRLELACGPNAITDKLLSTVAEAVAQVGDVRFGFQILLAAASLADKAGRKAIGAGEVASAAEEENRIRKIRELEALRDKLLKLKRKYEKN